MKEARKAIKAISIIQCITLITMVCTSVLVSSVNIVKATENPALPNVYLDTTYSSPSGNTITVNSGGDLQAALNNAQLGDKIILEASATFTGNYTLPNKTSGSGWIYIQSSAYSSLPVPNNRISPNDASNMPKILSPNTDPAIATNPSAHHYRFVGIEIATNNSNLTYNLILLWGGSGNTQLSNTPTDIVFDRCYIHGAPDKILYRGILVDSAKTSIIDSYISDVHDYSWDSQAIAGFNGPGPFKIVNNYLEASGENVMFGGVDATISNLVPSDIEFRNNYCFKPLSWFKDDSRYAGRLWAVKNLFELKNAQRVLVDGNIFENNWAMAQSGVAILFTPRNQDGANPWAVVQDITFTNNIVCHSGAGISLMAGDNNHPSQGTKNILIQNNLLYDIDVVKYDSILWYGGGIGGPIFLTSGGGPANGLLNVVIDHNTFDYSGASAAFFCAQAPVPTHLGFVFTNNIMKDYKFWGDSHGYGLSVLDDYCPSYVWMKNIMPGGTTAQYPGGGTYLPATFANIGFENVALANYKLASNSIYRNLGTDGKDIGTDIDALNDKVANAKSGLSMPTSTETVTPTPTVTPVPTPTSTPTSTPMSTPTPTPMPTVTPLLGDVTGDGQILASDALKVLQFITGKIVLSDEQKAAADVTKNGLIQASDALKILQYCSGKIMSF